VRAYPDALAALEALGKMGLRLGLISVASDHDLVERVLDRTGLAPYLDPVGSSAACGRVKPDPGIFQFVLQRWGSPPERCAMVGDTLGADVAGAQAVGMRAILVTMDPNPDNALVAGRIRPDATAATLEQVVQIIRTWTGHPAPGA
jgi:putative hydrolase of the HAD superfamily